MHIRFGTLSTISLFIVLIVGMSFFGAAAGEMATESTTTDVVQNETTQENITSTGTIGYWDGVWYNNSFSFDGTNQYLDAENRSKLLKRTIARVEYIRNDTFTSQPTLQIISRSQYQNGNTGYAPNEGAKKEWNNIVWKSLFIVDSKTNVESELAALYGGQTNAFYSPETKDMYMIVSQNQTELVKFNSSILAHELTHAYQDQRFDIDSNAFIQDTQNARLAKDSVVEGEAIYIERKFTSYCNENWDCYQPDESNSATSQVNLNAGLQVTSYFPYSDGFSYINKTKQTHSWGGVEQIYQNIPTKTHQIIHPDSQYKQSTKPLYIDNSLSRWEQYQSGSESVGEASLYVMFWYQQYEYNINAGVSESHLYSSTDGSTYNYSHPITEGLLNDEIIPYRHRQTDTTGYVFKTEWNTTADANEFVSGYQQILSGHNGKRYNTSLTGSMYLINNTPKNNYAGVYYINQTDRMVQITHAQTVSYIQEIRGKDSSIQSIQNNSWFNEVVTIPLPFILIIISSVCLLIAYVCVSYIKKALSTGDNQIR